MRTLCVDFETFFSTEFTLSKLTTESYIRDPRFKAHMLGVKDGDAKTNVFPTEQIPRICKLIPWEDTAILCHHTHFDGFILAHHYGVVPKFYMDTLSMARAIFPAESVALENLCKLLGTGQKGGAAHYNVVNTKGILNLSPQDYQACAAYCATDCDLTKANFDLLRKHFPLSEMRLIDLIIRLFTCPTLQLEPELLQEAWHDERMATLALFQRAMPQFAQEAEDAIERDDAGAWKKLKTPLASNPQFARMLLNLGVDPPKKLSPAAVKSGKASPDTDTFAPEGLIPTLSKKDQATYFEVHGEHHVSEIWAYAFGKTDEGFKYLLDHEDPMVGILVEARLGVKSTIKETRAQRFIGISGRGEFPIYLLYYGGHCVTGDVEVLTEAGWERLDQWCGGSIAQVHTDQRIEFLPATKFKGPTETRWVETSAPYLQASFTEGHTMPYLAHGKRTWRTVKAGVMTGKSYNIPIAGDLQTVGAITAEQMRVLVMVQADGSFEEQTSVGRRMCVFVKKLRKIERARAILTAAGVPFEEQVYPSHAGFVRFIVRHRDYPAWLTAERKFFGAWLLDSTADARTAFMEELLLWDGWTWGGQGCYSTTVQSNAEWAATMAHLTGNAATISGKVNKKKSHHSKLFTVAIRTRSLALIKRDQIRTVDGAPRATFCAVTQTGFWLARKDGRIFVTGNTGRLSGGDKINAQNLNKFCPAPWCNEGKIDAGKIIELERAQGDRWGKPLELPVPDALECPKCHGTGVSPLRRAIRAPEGHVIAVRDLSGIEARVLAWLAGQTDVVEAFRAGEDVYCLMASDIYGRTITKADKSPRFLGKAVVLGAGYGLGYKKFQTMLRVGMLGNAGVLLGADVADALNVNVPGYLHRNAGYVQESLPPGVSVDTHGLHCACADKVIRAFRDNKPKIPQLWQAAQDALGSILRGETVYLGTGNCISTCREGFMLPNGMKIRYTELEGKVSGRRVEYSILKNRRKGERGKVYGGLCVENLVQALARIILTDAFTEMHRRGIKVVHQVHDEILAVCREEDAQAVYDEMGRIMSTPPKWAPDLPLSSSGGWAQAYLK